VTRSEETVIESPVTPATPAVPVERLPRDPMPGDTGALRPQSRRAQAGFVDDPRAAVDDAAALVEQTAQALVGALRQRQQELRVLRESGSADGSSPTAPVSPCLLGRRPASARFAQ
jgi:hypothetical protein